MKKIVFLFLLFWVFVDANAVEQPENEVYANIYEDGILLRLEGKAAKDIFDSMPESSKLSSKENCYSGTIMKIMGGFVCRVSTNGDHYSCELEVSSKTGKAQERNRKIICSTEGV